MDPITQAGTIFTQILKEANNDPSIEEIVLSISMEGIEGALGVSTKCTLGLTSEEIVEIVKIAGRNSHKLVALDLSDYNPFIEDWSTGRLGASMFYWFSVGLSMRLI